MSSNHDARGSSGAACALIAMSALVLLPLSASIGLRTEATQRGAIWSQPYQLTILHTNDLHGQVLARQGAGGFLELGRRIRIEREASLRAGRGVLLLDAGDIFKGTLEGDLTDGAVVVDWMNRLGYDALAIGNHEFDHGVAVARGLAEAAKFPFLGANVRATEDRGVPGWLGKGSRGELAGKALIREAGPIRVAIVGLTSERVPELTVEGATEGLSFLDEAEELSRVLESLPLVDLVVVLSHAGLETDRELARRFDGRVHLIVGGHSHDRLSEGERVGGVLIAQAGSRGRELGKIEIDLRPPLVEGQPPRIESKASLVLARDDLPALLEPHLNRVRERAEQVVGQLTEDISRQTAIGGHSSQLGNLITDRMRAATKSDLAFQNRGGIRASLRGGPLSYRELYAVLPFGNRVVAMDLSGAQLLNLFETMFGSQAMSGLEVSGADVLFDPKRPEGQRILRVRVGGERLDPERTYRVATNDFLAGGKDGYTVFKSGTRREDTGRPVRDLLRDFLSNNTPYAPPAIDERFTRLD